MTTKPENCISVSNDGLYTDIPVPSSTLEVRENADKVDHIAIPDHLSSFFSGLLVGLWVAQHKKTIIGEDAIHVIQKMKGRIRFESSLVDPSEDYETQLMVELSKCGIEVIDE